MLCAVTHVLVLVTDLKISINQNSKMTLATNIRKYGKYGNAYTITHNPFTIIRHYNTFTTIDYVRYLPGDRDAYHQLHINVFFALKRSKIFILYVPSIASDLCEVAKMHILFFFVFFFCSI